MIRKLPHILAIFGVVCFVLILNHVKTSEKNKGIRLLRIAEETEKRIKLEYERKLNDLKRKEFIKRVEELLILSEEEIKIMFGSICHETIFQPGSDYSNYIVYDA